MNRAVDRRRIAGAFHRQAGEYDRHALVQKRVVSKLDRLVAAHLTGSPEQVLDIGCGTGALLAALKRRYPSVRPCGIDLAFNMSWQSAARLGADAMIVNGDAEQLPFREGAFDLVVSASTFQWVKRLDTSLEECCRVLKPGGLLCVAFFGGKTLWELQACYREALEGRFKGDDRRGERLQSFREAAEVQSLMAHLGYDQMVISSDMEMEYHADVAGLLRSIKGVGAATAARNDTGGGLGWRGVLTDMANIYRSRFEVGGMIPATYEVIYVIARRCAAG